MSTAEKLYTQGKLEGKLEGENEKSLVFIQSLIHNTDFDDAKIALLVGVSVDFVKEVRAKAKR